MANAVVGTDFKRIGVAGIKPALILRGRVGHTIDIDALGRTVVCYGYVGPGIGWDGKAALELGIAITAISRTEHHCAITNLEQVFVVAFECDVAVPIHRRRTDPGVDCHGRRIQGRSVRNLDIVVDAIEAKRAINLAVTEGGAVQRAVVAALDIGRRVVARPPTNQT